MSNDTITTLSADSVAASVRAAQGKGLPPVHEWNPPYRGDLDIRIARDGTWYHEGGAINRAGLVKLFAGILRREGDRYFLVTPVEKVGITVDDAPFVAVDVEAEGNGADQDLIFETNLGDRIVAGPANPIRVERDPDTGEPAPYVMIRDGLEALIDRKSFYRLAEIGCVVDGWFGLWSGGSFFRMIPETDLPDL